MIEHTYTDIYTEQVEPITMMYDACPSRWHPAHSEPTMKTKRNDPCSCGSGKRVKHCCRNRGYSALVQAVAEVK